MNFSFSSFFKNHLLSNTQIDHWLEQSHITVNIDGMAAQCCTVTFKGEQAKNCCFECSVCQVRGQSRWESSGRHSETFQDLPFFLFFFWGLHIKLCGCRSNPLLCQSSCSALAWKHSETACFHFSRGKAGLCFKSPAPPDVPWSREVDYALCVL